MLGVRLPGGHELTLVVYIDHNVGTLVKDAFAVPEPLSDMVAFMREKSGDPDTRWDDLDLADARARISDAVELAAITFPPFETDTWPASRALVEWAARMLPAGGTGYQRAEWDDAQLGALADRFFASSYAEGLGAHDRSLLDPLLWFGTGYGPGDPLRWSPVNVEILLTDWVPRKLVADAEYLSRVPTLLRALIKFSHADKGIRRSLTDETLAAVDRWEPEYQRLIRSPRRQGPAAVLGGLGLDLDVAFDADAVALDDLDDLDEYMLSVLRREVGSAEVLDRLDDRPLPDEPFAWSGIPDDVHERVREVLALLDRCCEEVLDVEYRTACRRFLARAAAGDPNIFRRKGRADTAAGAVAWIIGKANWLFGYGGRGMYAKDLLAHFGLSQGSVSQRASTLLRAGGFETAQYGGMVLGSPDLLVSTRRRQIMQQRDRYVAALAEREST